MSNNRDSNYALTGHTHGEFGDMPHLYMHAVTVTGYLRSNSSSTDKTKHARVNVTIYNTNPNKMTIDEIHAAIAAMGSGDQQVACTGYVCYTGGSGSNYEWYWVPYVQCAPGNAFKNEIMVRYVSCSSPTTTTTYPNYGYIFTTASDTSSSEVVNQIF